MSWWKNQELEACEPDEDISPEAEAAADDHFNEMERTAEEPEQMIELTRNKFWCALAMTGQVFSAAQIQALERELFKPREAT